MNKVVKLVCEGGGVREEVKCQTVDSKLNLASLGKSITRRQIIAESVSTPS